jgi:hypothetical protein
MDPSDFIVDSIILGTIKVFRRLLCKIIRYSVDSQSTAELIGQGMRYREREGGWRLGESE